MSRQSYWVDGLYQDSNGHYRFDGQIDADTFVTAAVHVGREETPDLLCDLHVNGSLDLAAHPGVVAEAWSDPEYPERSVEPDLWVKFFRTAGYTYDGQRATPPTEPITVYRGCTPDGRKGMAWTSDIEIARRFAHGQLRGRPLGHVYVFEAPPEAMLAFIHENGREESEYVIDNAYLRSAVRLFER